MIADDSVVYRNQIRTALSGLPWAEVVGVASNGRLAVDRMQQVPVDVLVLDLEMPEMDGLATLAEIKRLNILCKVIVFSSASKRGATITLEALSLGASEFVTKPGSGDDLPMSGEKADPAATIRGLLVPKILALFGDLGRGAPERQALEHKAPRQLFPKQIWDLLKPEIVVIGSSTGGPTVLETIFSQITGPLRCPILVTQHMPPIFTATLAERIQRMSGVPTYEAKDRQAVENAIYIAPGNYHMRVVMESSNLRIALDQGPLQNSVRPAVDPLFQSAAEIFKSKCLGFVLTGMGADGRVGAEKIKESGGTVIIQDESSCVVYGMPGAVHSSGAFDFIMNPSKIVESLVDKVANANGSTHQLRKKEG